MKQIANELSTSDSFVDRELIHAERDFQPNRHYLPEVILIDKIKSTKSVTDAMSFEFMNAKTNELIDLLPFQIISQLEKYLRRFDQTTKEGIKIIVTDMNYTYLQLVKTVFLHVIVVVDKFHIINALSKTQIRLMKSFASASRELYAFKSYWKLLLVPVEQLDFKHFYKWTNFLTG